MKTLYIANDGKEFDDFVSCRDYDEELEKKELEKKKFKEEKDAAYKEVLKKKCEYMDALNDYNSKYTMNCRSNNFSVDFSDLYDTLKKFGFA